MNDRILATLPATSAHEQIVVLLTKSDDGQSRVSLAHQSWAPHLGWYTQQRIDLEPRQAAALRQALGSPESRPAAPSGLAAKAPPQYLRLHSESA